MISVRILVLLSLIITCIHAQNLNWARQTVDRVEADSFPELRGADIRVHLFQSKSDYFKSRFAIPQFFFRRKMQYIVFVNPEVRSRHAPGDAVTAVIAHELEHIVQFRNGNRLRLLGLVRLVSKRYTARFEKETDLRTVAKGFGEGLREYRVWLYLNIPPDQIKAKKRNYLTPDEIDKILRQGAQIQPR